MEAEGLVQGSQDRQNSSNNRFFSRIKLDDYLAPMDPSQNRGHLFFAQACGPSVGPERTRGDKLKKEVGGGVGRYLCFSDLTP